MPRDIGECSGSPSNTHSCQWLARNKPGSSYSSWMPHSGSGDQAMSLPLAVFNHAHWQEAGWGSGARTQTPAPQYGTQNDILIFHQPNIHLFFEILFRNKSIYHMKGDWNQEWNTQHTHTYKTQPRIKWLHWKVIQFFTELTSTLVKLEL